MSVLRAALTAGAAGLLLHVDRSGAVVYEAIAAVESTTDPAISGTVRFTQTFGSSCVRVKALIYNLPDGEHGFHVHQYGDLTTTADLSSLGAHFVPCVVSAVDCRRSLVRVVSWRVVVVAIVPLRAFFRVG